MSNNIIDFTKFKVDREEEKFDQLTDEIDAIDHFSGDFAFSLVADINEALYELDYNTMDNPESILELLAIVEATRALIFRIAGLPYPFQKVSESVFKEIFEEQGGDYQTALSNLLNGIQD